MADMQSQSAPEQAREKVQEVAQNAQQQARSRVSDQVDQRSTQVGEQASTTAQALRQSSQQLREKGSEAPARFVEQAADKIENAGSWLRDSDGDTLLSDVEDFGRRNPWAVVAGGIAAGFAASRFLKASSQRRSPQYSGGSYAYSRPRPRTGNGYSVAAPDYAGAGTGAGYAGATGYDRIDTPPVGVDVPPATTPSPTLPGATTLGDRS